MGTYTYGDSAHLHAVTSIGSGPTYTAKYDAVGNMTCRAPDNTTTCASTPTGAQLGYDNEGRLATWQNAPTSPTTTDSFLYDGEGQRVEQQVTVNGSMTTTTTYVAGGLEEITANGAGTTLTKYFTGANGLPTAERVGTGGPLSYLATDGQGTVSASLDSTGNVTSSQLYTPYGNARYSSGSSPTSMGYTGQRADSSTGLDFYSARYYDPVAGQFVSADTVADGLNRYGYVTGNPTTATDPSGHYQCFDDSCTRGGGKTSSGPPTTPPTGCHSDGSCGCYASCGRGGSGGSGGGTGSSGGGAATGGGGVCGEFTLPLDDGGCDGSGAAACAVGSTGGFASPLSDGCGGLSGDQVQQLYDDAQAQGFNLTEWDIEQMIKSNPGLSQTQYELLVQLWGEGTRAFNVKEIAYAEDGRLVWLNAKQLEHIILDHGDDFRNYFSVRVEGIPMVSEETVIGTIFRFLTEEEPEGVNGNRYVYGFWASPYDRWRGVEKTFEIAVLDNGMITTAFVP